MSAPRTFLLCEDADHAATVDWFIAERLREIDGSKCSQWSGIFTDGERFGVLWDNPASSLFGTPEDDLSIQLADEVLDEDGASNWAAYVPPVEEQEDDV